mgnify:CR=1 FL=1
MKKVKKKVGIIMIILLLLSSYLTPLINAVNAFSVSNAYIYSVKDPEYHLQYWNESKNAWYYIITTYVGYTGEDGKFYPAYCLNADRHGVGEEAPYTVTVTEAIQNPEVWRVLYNGFPYKTPSELGVENDYDAFCATKQAVYCVLYGYNPSTRYKGGDDRGTKIAQAIVNIVNTARNTSGNYTSPQCYINKVGNLTKEGEYYSQTYSVSSNVPLRDYYVYQISGLPSGSYFASTNGSQKTTFSAGENFKVYIPQKSIVSNVSAYIGVDSSCKTYPALYGQSPNSSLQNYALVLDPFENGSADTELNIAPTGEVTIEKTSATDNIWNGTLSGSLIPNAKYNLYNDSMNLIGTYTTNSEGKIHITGLSLGTYYVRETTPVPQYTTLNDTTYSFKLDFIDDSETLKVKNTPIPGGYFSAVKVSERNNVWTGVKKGQGVSGAKYGIYDTNGNIVKSYETGKELIAISKEDGKIFDNEKLQIGEYYLQEIEAPEHSKKNDKKYYFKVTENGGHVSVTASDDVEEGGYFNIYKTSNDVNLWTAEVSGTPLANATFKIEYTNFEESKNWTVTTNKDGKIVDSNYSTDDLELKLGTYRIYEIKAPNHYELDGTEYYFRITENEQKVYLELDNTPELGNNVKITKVASDKNYITGTEKGQPISGAKYEVRTDFDENTEVTKDNFSNGKLVDTLVTDKNGNTKTLTVGKGTYYVKEVSVPDGWKLDEKVYKIEVIANGITHKLELEDEPIPQGFFNIDKTALEKNYWTGDEPDTPLEGVKFELRDKDDNVLMELVTDKYGKFSEDIMLEKGTYYLWETEAPEHYIKSDKPDVFEITENGQKVTIDIKNKVEVAGFVDVSKVASKDNEITGEQKDTYIPNAKYRIENIDTEEVVAELITTEQGYLEEKLMLGAGNYKIYEVDSPKYYLIDSSIYYFTISENGQEVCFDFKDNPVEVKINVEKSGIVQAQPNDEIRYDFDAVESLSNVPLDNFTFIDNLPYEKVKLTKLFTGIYTDKVEFDVYYKTNLSEDWILIKENLDSTVNNFIDFSGVELKDNEVITDFKMEFGTVPEYFKAKTTPFIFTKVNEDINADDIWTNYVNLSGTYLDVNIKDKSEWTTKTYKKELTIKKLPRTGE